MVIVHMVTGIGTVTITGIGMDIITDIVATIIIIILTVMITTAIIMVREKQQEPTGSPLLSQHWRTGI